MFRSLFHTFFNIMALGIQTVGCEPAHYFASTETMLSIYC